MSPPWQHEYPVDQTLVRRILADQMPHVDLSHLVHAGGGWDHEVWRAEELVFRFPHQKDTASLAARRAPLMNHLASSLPCPIPIPVFVGDACDGYPGQFVCYDWLPGQLPAYLPLSQEDRARAAEPLALCLRTLHSIASDEVAAWNLSHTPIDGSMEERTTMARSRANQLALTPYADLATSAVRAMNPAPEEVCEHECRLIHGDVYAGQLLFDKEHQLAAIIDWDEVCIGDPAFDLMIVYSFIPKAARAHFWSLYGNTSSKARARHLALSYGLAILAQSMDTGHAHFCDEAAFSLRNALEEG